MIFRNHFLPVKFEEKKVWTKVVEFKIPNEIMYNILAQNNE